MFNTIERGANAFLGIFNNLPVPIFRLIVFFLVVNIIAFVVKIVMR